MRARRLDQYTPHRPRSLLLSMFALDLHSSSSLRSKSCVVERAGDRPDLRVPIEKFLREHVLYVQPHDFYFLRNDEVQLG